MIVFIDSDEAYPVWRLSHSPQGCVTVDVPESMVNDWKRIQDEYDSMQMAMKALERAAFNAMNFPQSSGDKPKDK